MKEFSTADRLKQIMRERGIKQVDIIEACQPYCKKYCVRLKKNDLSQYVSGKVEPKQDKLSILGMALNVSEAWLMGYDVPMERQKSSPPESIKLTEGEKKLLELFRKIPEEQQTLVLQMIAVALNNQE